jgi:type III secretion system FlhB-like substrate exporter
MNQGYASIGYKAHNPTSSETQSEDVGSIFDGKNFEPHFLQSLNVAKKSVAICAPQICISGNNRVAQTLAELAKRGISVTIFTQTQTTMTEYLLLLGANMRIVPVQLYCAVIDKSETWYGSINYLGYNSVGQNAIVLTDNTVAASILAVAAE